jgi:hypothetical protein
MFSINVFFITAMYSFDLLRILPYCSKSFKRISVDVHLSLIVLGVLLGDTVVSVVFTILQSEVNKRKEVLK